MTFDLDVATKLLGFLGGLLAFFVGLNASLKAWREFSHLLRAQRRVEYEFARKLSDSSKDSNIERYASELGYAALVGDRHLQHKQRKFLLSLPDAEQKCAAYMRARDLLAIEQDPPGFKWKVARYARPAYRCFQKWIWSIAYVAAGVSAFLPLIFWAYSSPRLAMPAAMWAVQGMTAVYFLPVAAWCLVTAKRIGEAEKLMGLREDGCARS